MNRFELIGILGKAPKVLATKNGDTFVSFTLAVNRRVPKDAAENVQRVDWIPLTAFGKLADVIAKHCKKGMKIYVEGKISAWEDFDEEDIHQRYKIGHHVTSIEFLSSGKTYKDVQSEPFEAFDNAAVNTSVDDIPF